MTTHALARDLMDRAICNTDRPGDAVAALLTAAGQMLHVRFGDAAAIAILRSIVDQTEAAWTARHGRQEGEAVQ